MMLIRVGRAAVSQRLTAYGQVRVLSNIGFDTHNKRSSKFTAAAACLVGGVVGAGVAVKLWRNDEPLQAKANTQPDTAVPNLPTYKSAEISKHYSLNTGVWVSYKKGVYDITKFIGLHPGGDKLMMAAGGALEPFWQLYSVHNTPEITEMLEKYRIGNLDPADETELDTSDPYATDPRRHPVLTPSSVKPFNAEPPAELLVDNFYTPQQLFYVRNHLPVPEVDPAKYELEVSGLGVKSLTLKLDDIKKLPKHTITATVMCAGNRRSEMTKIKPVKGLNWSHAVIGNAKWTGVKLIDVLKKAGLSDTTTAKHIQFEGLDTDPASMPYGASIPIEKALDPRGDVILAYEMNGEPLSRDHGFPIRVVVPGVVGARCVKWLSRIVVSEDESDAHWQQNDYKGFSPSVDWDTVDFTKSPAIQDLPVISAICIPKQEELVDASDGTTTVKGYAWSGGGRKIVRVDVSADQGKTWHVAKFVGQDSANHPYHWGWTLWTIDLPVKRGTKVEIWAKAVDSSYNTQPENVENIWNLRGVLSNAYHKVKVTVKK